MARASRPCWSTSCRTAASVFIESRPSASDTLQTAARPTTSCHCCLLARRALHRPPPATAAYRGGQRAGRRPSSRAISLTATSLMPPTRWPASPIRARRKRYARPRPGGTPGRDSGRRHDVQRPVDGPIRRAQLFQTGRQLLHAAQCAGLHAGQRPQQHGTGHSSSRSKTR